MRRCVALLGLAALVAAMPIVPADAGVIDSELARILASKRADETVSALVFMKDQVDIDALSAEMDRQRVTMRMRHETVVRSLQQMAESTQGKLRDHLEDLETDGRIDNFRAFWIANAFRVEATVGEIYQLANHSDVGTVYFNYEIELIEPVSVQKDTPGTRTVETGVVAVRAPEAWAMGYTGEGVLVANMDSGVDGNHPALASRWAGVADSRYAGHPEWAWYDPYAGQNDFPYDNNGHGTHTMGSVCGGAPGDEVGVAPGALWIASAPVDRGGGVTRTVADAILSFQWMVDPDGNPETNWDVPAVCSNSWGVTTAHGYPPCDETLWTYLDACEAAGTVILFSAGNEGTAGLRRPADRATDDYRTCAVAAVDARIASWPVTSASSRGPTYCTPSGDAAIKPDIAAPGAYVRSAYRNGGYATLSGTSMAAPHINGVVALIRQACPDLSVQEVKEVIFETAHDLGSAGKDNAYGWGMVDAYEAVSEALDRCYAPRPPRAYDGNFEAPSDTPVTVELRATDYDGGPNPISWEVVSLPAMQLADAGNGHVITAGELPYTLVSNGNEVIYTPSGGFYGNDSFTFQATDGGTPPEGGYSEIATVTGLVLFGPPTIVTETLPEGCLDLNYGPFQLQADQGQPELSWSLINGDEYIEIDLGENLFEATGTAMNWHADDNSWSYALPFTFPFFTGEYTTIYVSSNGLIDFDGGDYDSTNNDAELIANTRIAGLWDDIRTDLGGDIHIDSSVPCQLTVRWDGEHYASGDPIDFSVTLFEDGTIRFNYGGTNTGLSPTIGISSGDGTHYLLSTYNNAGSLTWADSHEFTQLMPLPAGMVFYADGLLTGAPTETGTFEPRFRVTDSLDRSDVRQLLLVINEECVYGPGDMNCDGAVDFDDIDPFVAALTGEEAYLELYPDCLWMNADTNHDGNVDFDDIDPFVALLASDN